MTLLAAYLILLISLLGSTFGLRAQNGTSIGTSLPVRERYRRLIPYFTYYLGGAQGQQYRPPPMPAVSYVPVPPHYRAGAPTRIQPQPSPLTKMIIQNYLTLSKANGNPRLQTRILPQDLNYYIPLPRPIQHAVGPLDGQDIGPNIHYPKPNVVQYVKPVPEIEYNKQPDVDYEREEEDEREYEKPLDTIIQYANPQVQQYISKFDNKIPIRDFVHPQSPAEYPGNPIQNEAISLKPRLPFHYKAPETIKFASKHPKNHHFPSKSEVTSHKLEPAVTIMQSQELDVDALSSTTPTPIRYHATYISRPEGNLGSIQEHNYDHHQEQEQEYDETISEQNLDNILQGVTIPNKITPQNLDESIRTLSKLLQILQKANSLPNSAKDIISTFPKPGEIQLKERPIKAQTVHPDTEEGGTPGRPGVDYPAYDEIPPTRFSCKEQRYKGFFGDPETGCQVWHYCDLNGGQASFLCPNGTIFSQVALTCDWWFNVKCASTAQLYVLNERLYKYILPQKLSFPEDYSGPLVDHYLTLKFKEIEEKNKNKTEANRKEDKEKEEEPMTLDTTIQNKIRSIG